MVSGTAGKIRVFAVEANHRLPITQQSQGNEGRSSIEGIVEADWHSNERNQQGELGELARTQHDMVGNGKNTERGDSAREETWAKRHRRNRT